ncbi:MAG: hypothetical protein R6V33_05410 [Pelovirga sp.]
MKKIVAILVFSLFFCGSSFAMSLDDVLTATKTSNGVDGVYFANNSGNTSDDATDFIIGTGHSQGTVTYATANFVSEIYSKGIEGDKYASSDLIGEVGYASDGSDLTDWAD